MDSSSRDFQDFLNLDEFEASAKSILSPMAYAYFSGGACDQFTLRENVSSWNNIKLWPRVLRGVSNPDLSTSIFGQSFRLPFYPAPVAMLKLAHPEGELAVRRAMNRLHLPYFASTMATTSLEDIAGESTTPSYFQLYCFKDHGLTKSLVQRAEQSGFKGLVITVDAQMLGKREADIRHRFHLPSPLKLENLDHKSNLELHASEGSGAERISAHFDASLNWKSLEAILGQTKLPWAIKGVLHPEDGVIAADMGAKAIFISNHGGRQLDCVPTAIDVLPLFAKALAGSVGIFVDGGIRRGTDIVKAILLGADGVLIGKPMVWALACGGAEGVIRMMNILEEEFRLALCLLGCSSLKNLRMEHKF